MTLAIDKMTHDQKSCLLYLETCAVDHGGLVEGQRMNREDHDAAKVFQAAGLVELHRIPSFLLDHTGRPYTHWCRLTDAGFTLAHTLRQQRAMVRGPLATEIMAELAERGKIAINEDEAS